MIRRDQFANAAMAAILSERPWVIEDESGRTHLAFRAYRMAEAMEREAMQRDAMEREARVQEAKHGDD